MSSEPLAESFSSGWDNTFLDFSSKIAEPLCTAFGLLRYRLVAPLDPGAFENCASLTHEKIVRGMLFCGAALAAKVCVKQPFITLGGAAALMVGWIAFRALGFAFQKEGYSYIQGRGAERSFDAQDPQLKVMSWNICGFAGRLSLSFGGMNPWQTRIDAIVAKIREQDPDVLVLQEVFDVALAKALVEKLKDIYPHFYTHLGPNVFSCMSGCMVISKCISHSFSFTSFTNNSGAMNRGFAVLELKARSSDSKASLRIITTHLEPGLAINDKEVRIAQAKQIKEAQEKASSLPTLLEGDLNTEPEDLPEVLNGRCEGAHAPKPTCTNVFTHRWRGKATGLQKETIDYILIYKNAHSDQIALKHCPLVEAFDPDDTTKKPLSDHHAVAAIVGKRT